MPFKNEIDGLKRFIADFDFSSVDEVFFLDGQSTDGSFEFLKDLKIFVHKQSSKGVKAAFWEAFDQIKSDVIIPFSPDGNSDPSSIPVLINKIKEGNDIVIASRYLAGQVSADDNWESAIANFLFTSIINFLFGLSISDGIGMYKAFKRHHLFELKISNHRHEHSEILLIIRGARYGLKITEVFSKEGPRVGPGGSRAHPGYFGKYKSACIIFKSIIRDFIFYWPNRK